MNYCKLRWSVIVLILAIVISSNYCFGKDDTNNNKGNSIAKDTDNSEVSEKEDHIVTPDQDSNSANSENLDEGEKKEDGDKKEEGDNKEEGEKKEGDKNEDDEKKEGDKNEEGEKKEEGDKKEDGDNKEEVEKKEEGDNKEEGEKKEEGDKKEDGEKKEEDKKEDGEKKDGIEKFGENSDIENGIIDNKEDSVEDQENTESQKEEEKKDNGDGEQQDSIHTSIMEGLYKLDYKLKFLRRMLRKDKKMIIQIHALGYLVNTIKEQIVRDVAALNAIVKLEAENASELNKLQSVHDNHVNNRLDFIKHENIVQVNN
ncbi:putative signal peptide-containing protein [Cryptosporidium hominis]